MATLRNLFSPDAAKRRLVTVARRFPFPLAYISLFAVWMMADANNCFDGAHVLRNSMSWALFEGFLLSLVVNLWCEFSGKIRAVRPLQLCVFALVAVDFAAMCFRGSMPVNAEVLGRTALVSALVAGILFLPIVKRYCRRELWIYTISQLFALAMAVVVGVVILIALCIIMATLNALFHLSCIDFMETMMWLLAFWLPCVYYMSSIPRRRNLDVGLTKTVVGAFCKNVLLPIVVVYGLILYVYALKILVTWTLPDASVTMMVTGLMIATLVALYGLERYSFGGDNPAVAVRIGSLARRILPVALLPLVVLMSVGLVYRIGEYGITTSRLYVAAFNIWAYATLLYLIFRKRANLNLIAVSFTVVFAMVSIIPGLNFTVIAQRVVRGEVRKALVTQGVKAFPIGEDNLKEILADMDYKDAENLVSKIEYLDDWEDHSQISDMIKSDSHLFSYDLLPDTALEVTCPVRLAAKTPVAIPEGYTKVDKIYGVVEDSWQNDNGSISCDFENYTLNINPDSLKSARVHRTPLAVKGIDVDGQEAAIVITELSMDERPRINISFIECYIFTR